MAQGPTGQVMVKFAHLNRDTRQLELHSLNPENKHVYYLNEWQICGAATMIQHGIMIEFDNGKTLKAIQPEEY
jgi:hypothetical protein